MMDRRSFIHKTTLGVTSLVLMPGSLVLGSSASPQELQQRLFRAAKARKNNRINRAIRLFKSIIRDFPSEIRAYDGLRKTLLMRKHNELEVLKLYKKGFRLNPGNKDFKERLAKEYISISLGNKKVRKQLNNPDKLLIKARKMFRELKNDFPERLEYKEQLRKVRRKILQQADKTDARQNTAVKEYRKIQKTKYRNRFKNKSIFEIEDKLQELLYKPKNESRDKHIKELYKILIIRSRKAGDFDGAFYYARSFYDYDKNESIALQLVKKMAKKSANYTELINIAEENHSLKHNFWSNLNRFDSYFLSYKKAGIVDLIEVESILEETENQILTIQQKQEVLMRKVKINFHKKDFEASKESLALFGEHINATENKHNILLFTVLSARYYKKIKQERTSLQVLDVALDFEEGLDEFDEFSELVDDVVSNVHFEHEAHVDRLNKFRNNLLEN